jgi:hypothetical protein
MMKNLSLNKKPTFLWVCLLIILAFSCKKDKQQPEDPDTLPAVTSMEYFSYDGKIYTDGPRFYNRFILNDLGVPNSVIQINGHNFIQDYKDSKVLFNNISAVALWGDSTQIVVMIPDNVPPGPVTLTINTNGKSLIHPTKFTVAVPKPQISGLSVESGMAGSKVIIYGSDFSTTRANNKVTVNGINATVDSAALSAIYITVPASSGTGKVSLTTHGVTLTSKNDFSTMSSIFNIIDPGTTGFGLQNLALDAAGNIYGTIDNTVYKISAGGTTAVFATIPRSADAVPYIGGCAVDASGNVYISSPYTAVPSRLSVLINGPSKIYKITPTGTLSVFAGKDYPGYADGLGSDAMFKGPRHLQCDASGNLYVNDQSSIRKITPNGTVSTLVDNVSPAAMAFEATTGSLYIIETLGGGYGAMVSARIRKITSGGAISIPTINPLPGATAGGLFPDLLPYDPFYQSTMHMVVDASGDLLVATGTTLYTIKNSVITNTYLNPTYGRIIALAIDPTGKVYLTLPKIANKQDHNDKFVIYKVTP